MNEVERGTILVRAQEGFDLVARNFGIHRLQTGQRENGVVEIGPAVAIQPRTRGGKLVLEKGANELRGIPQQSRREPGHLQQLKAKTHPARATNSSAAVAVPIRSI